MTQPTGLLADILSSLDSESRALLLEHIKGGTSTVWLSAELKKAGFTISSTTLKEQRARLNG